MSWDSLADEIAEEFGGAERIEFFSSDGYSFRRLDKLEDLDPRLVERLRSRRWKLAHPERCREHKRKSIAHRMEVDPVGQRAMRQRRKRKWEAKNPEKVRAMAARAYAKVKDSPEYQRKNRERAKAAQAAAYADPIKAEALRARKREWARQKAARAA